MKKNHALILERAINIGHELVAGGAQAIIPLGGLLFPYEVSPEELESEIGVTVINTKAVGIRFAELMVSSKAIHSKEAYACASGLSLENMSRRTTHEDQL
ncbi:hypothetical protein ACFL0M_05850 [Thermodesulfobacteriota bacterium]